MDKNDTIKEEIKKFILEEFLPKGHILRDDELLFDSGIIDSLGVIKLTVFLEKNFKISISPSEVAMDNFNSVNKIAEFINQKKEGDA